MTRRAGRGTEQDHEDVKALRPGGQVAEQAGDLHPERLLAHRAVGLERGLPQRAAGALLQRVDAEHGVHLAG
ncbi:hypothetical protein [Streptomyces blattellae]|uniref:hypothetical protein n=1 Tax=Streptomyces blattellae TaxID=2569855 RepID=UPI0012B8F731|nr:hypothetical protein [Streptomyces blattellae]